MKKTIKDELDLLFHNDDLKCLIKEHYGEYLLHAEDINLIEFFDLEADEKCDAIEKKIKDFVKSFIPIFQYDETSLLGYWIEGHADSHNNLYMIEFSSYGSITFFGKVSMIEYFVFNISETRSIYRKIQNNLSTDNITIRNKKEIENILGHFKKVSPIYKKVTNFLDNIDELCKHGRILEPKKPKILKSELKEWMHPRYGLENPTKVNSKVWEYGVASKESAYALCKSFKVKQNYDTCNPSWSFDRFGKSITFLDNGIEIHIAGEHEDWYDPDFYIYNDVTVVYPNDMIEFYIYPKDIFIATDFHSATLYKDGIIIIGNLGYENERKYGYTQVYKLDIKSFRITKIETTGNMPGWIHNHKATLNEYENSIVIEKGLVDIGSDVSIIKNVDKWELNLETKVWRRLTNTNTTQLIFKRKDDGWHNLFDFYLYCEYHKNDSKEFRNLEKKLGFTPQPKLYEQLYDFNLPDVEIIQKESYDYIKIKVGKNILEIDESSKSIDVLIIGALSSKDLEVIKSTILKNLEELERTVYVVEIIK